MVVLDTAVDVVSVVVTVIVWLLSKIVEAARPERKADATSVIMITAKTSRCIPQSHRMSWWL
jgi:hypothetical protein